MSQSIKINHDFPVLDHPDALNFEANRLKTFHGWSIPVSAVKLAQSGFFHTGCKNETQCYMCKKKYSDWTHGDKPYDIHRKLFPTCGMVTGLMFAAGVPVNIVVPSRQRGSVIRTHSFMDFRKLVCKLPIQETGACVDNFVHYLGVHFRPIGFRHDRTVIPRSSDGSIPYTALVDVEVVQAPLYPEFSSSVKRLSTFEQFPIARIVEQLCHHGFFFVGLEDIVLCHYCGLGLQNWQPVVDPRIAHIRWRPSCPYLQSVETPEFIHRSHRELLVVGASR